MIRRTDIRSLRGRGGRRMPHSSRAVIQKQTAVPYSTGVSPQAVYTRLPRKGVTSPAREETWPTRALPCMTASPSSIWGTQACTVGDSKAPSTDSATSSPAVTGSPPAPGNSSAAASTQPPESPSSATMMARRSARSARMPPKGESRMVGSIARASSPAKTAAEPVCSRMYMEMANFSV